MGDACKVLAAVTADSLQIMGTTEGMHIYICSMAGVSAPVAAPVVCGAAGAAYAVGKWAQTPAGKGLIESATEAGCDVVVRVSEGAAEIVLVKGAEAETKIDNFMYKAEKTYQSLNSMDGIHWLMRRLSGG